VGLRPLLERRAHRSREPAEHKRYLLGAMCLRKSRVMQEPCEVAVRATRTVPPDARVIQVPAGLAKRSCSLAGQCYRWVTSWLASLAGPCPPPPAYGRLASAESVGGSEVVPPATLTDLDHIDPEFAVFGRHLR